MSAGAAASGEPAIQARGLVKRYGRIIAVDHVDLTVSAGDVYGYLGPNGAGQDDDAAHGARAHHAGRGLGRAVRPRPAGRRRERARRRGRLRRGAALLPLPDRPPNLELSRRSTAATRPSGSTPRSSRRARRPRQDKVGGYSHGMRQRLGMAGALLRDPKLLHPRRARHRPRPRRHARHAPADPPARRRRHDRPALLAPHGRGRGALRPRRDHQQRARALRGRARRPHATTSGRYELRTTDDDRAAAIARAQRGIEDAARGARGLSFTAEERRGGRSCRSRSVEAGIGIAALVPAHGDARGAVLPDDRGGRGGRARPPGAADLAPVAEEVRA